MPIITSLRRVVPALLATSVALPAAQLVEVRTMDDQHVCLHWLDGQVDVHDTGTGKGAFMGHESAGGDVAKRFDPPLDPAMAADPASYVLRSLDDPAAAPIRPVQVFRRSKVNGNDFTWPEPLYTLEHHVFLRLSQALKPGRYGIEIAKETNSDRTMAELVYDPARSETEALHVNRLGYLPGVTAMKSADLYLWLGDGGSRDYSAAVGKPVQLLDVASGRRHEVGTVAFWKKQAKDVGNWDLTHTDVWTCDFSTFTGTGTFRLVVDGIGCSPEFRIGEDVYRTPFATAVRGFYYMRVGEAKDAAVPPPRQPRFLPGKDPEGFTVYRTTLAPWHPDWAKIGGDVWDKKTQWEAYKEPGSPTNPEAWGGHADACDWDRNLAHPAIAWDLLLPYVLSGGRLNDDDTGIRESGNGIPDLIDEALYEIDFWLRLRDGNGDYCAGLNNPTDDLKTIYQAAARPYVAWVNALSCAMAAESFRIAKRPELMARYRDEAITAWNRAKDADLDYSFSIGNGGARGRDLKMMAGAFLYNVTGERIYEDAMAAECLVADGPKALDDGKTACQYWGVAAYLMCARDQLRPIHHPQLVERLRQGILAEALAKNVEPSKRRPSRRSTDDAHGWFQSIQMVHPAVIAHALAIDPAQQDALLAALVLEADYGLGRNPMNTVLMTGLGSRHVDRIYTTGRNDGVPGVHPGHTPYMNAGPWGNNFMSDPMWYAKKGYPVWDQWPHGEALWPAPYCFSNNEFTPQQTMRGKMLLLGYLYSLRAKE